MEEENQTTNPTENGKKMHTRKCPYCKQEYETKIGFDNWKNIFRKPTLDDWIVLVILILLLVAAFAYTTETKICRETFSNLSKLDEICMKRQNQINYTWNGVPVIPNVNYTIENETEVIEYVPYSDSNASSNSTIDSNVSNASF
jgi:hypothetical protein